VLTSPAPDANTILRIVSKSRFFADVAHRDLAVTWYRGTARRVAAGTGAAASTC